MDKDDLKEHLTQFDGLPEVELQRLLHEFIAIHGDPAEGLGSIVAYSGPRKAVVEKFSLPVLNAHKTGFPPLKEPKNIFPPIKNFKRAADLARLLGSRRIDDTKMGVQLFKVWHIYNIFKSMYPNEQKIGNDKADLVASALSRLFIRAAEGQVFTCVCGAARDRVFMTQELPELLKNRRITHINGRDTRLFRKRLQQRVGYDDTAEREKYQEDFYRQICLSEIAFKRQLAKAYPTYVTKLDYLQSRELFQIDQSLQREALTPEGLPYSIIGIRRGANYKTGKALRDAHRLQIAATLFEGATDISAKTQLLSGVNLPLEMPPQPSRKPLVLSRQPKRRL